MIGYEEALDYLYSFVNLEHRRIEQYSPENISLSRPAKLLSLLGDPHRAYPSIHIAGTKGKGSVAAFCAFSLREAGFRVGLYTSPHLQDFRDRIRVLTKDDSDGRIAESQVANLVEEIRMLVAQVPDLTWYELVTALGFLHFAREFVDVAVVEVGLGGRLDATNLLTPLVSVITSLSLDHTALLGENIVDIAGEKGGIIKPGVPVVISSQRREAMARLAEIAQARHAPLIQIGRDWQWRDKGFQVPTATTREWPGQEIVITRSPEGAICPPNTSLRLALAGHHQQENALAALAALSVVQPFLPDLTLKSVRIGLARVEWPGRLQILSQGELQPTLLLDCAHNVDSAQKLIRALQEFYPHRHLWLIIGVTADKDVEGILRVMLPQADFILLTSSSHPRASETGELVRLATSLGFEARPEESVVSAVTTAFNLAGPGDLVCVSGSIFVVGDLLNQWEGLKSDLKARGVLPIAQRDPAALES